MIRPVDEIQFFVSKGHAVAQKFDILLFRRQNAIGSAKHSSHGWRESKRDDKKYEYNSRRPLQPALVFVSLLSCPSNFKKQKVEKSASDERRGEGFLTHSRLNSTRLTRLNGAIFFFFSLQAS
jgi:hypothetical protein